jgi:Arc/MetJ family transcription regulator
MRTNIDIDDDVLDAAMKAGSFKTKKDAVEAGLRLIARQAAYREILRWEGKLRWDGDDEGDAETEPGRAAVLSTGGHPGSAPAVVQEPAPTITGKRRHAGR